MIQNTFGTKEWAEKTKNIIKGCQHDCLYCYAKADAVRFGRCTPKEWGTEVVNQKALRVKIRPKAQTLMFPSAHDITPEHLPETLIYLEKVLVAYPSVLVVSKPHKECIEAICHKFPQFRDKVTFRFSIGSASDTVLEFWEPNAPSFQERMDCLRMAHEQGFKTSVSCEPMLDNDVDEVIRLVRPFVTDSIWLGKINNLKARLKLNGHNNPETMAKAEELLAWQSDENIRVLAKRLKAEPLIRLKESIRKQEAYDE